jgi:predicted adenylyl cyclase CyaB
MASDRTSDQLLESEVKIACRENLLLRHPDIELRLLESRHFEDNWLLDYEDGQLTATHRVLRLRAVNDRGWLTFKAPPQEHPWLKVRSEIEVAVEAPELMLNLLEAVGLKRIHRYQKFRTGYLVVLTSGRRLLATFDETPMGNFLELEGEDQTIAELVNRLGIRVQDLIQSSYPALWAQWLKSRGEPIRDMVFPEPNSKEQ